MPILKVLRSKIRDRSKNNPTNYDLSTQHFKVKLGFTLIELLIVIMILGILSAVVSRTFIAAQQRSRDAVRKSDLAQIKKSLELAKQDCKGSSWYPVFLAGTCNNNESRRFSCLRSYLSDPDLKYMPNVPLDPRGDNYKFNTGAVTGTVCLTDATPPTLNQSGTTDYMLRAALERGTDDPDSAATYAKCAGKPNMPSNSQGHFYVCNE